MSKSKPHSFLPPPTNEHHPKRPHFPYAPPASPIPIINQPLSTSANLTSSSTSLKQSENQETPSLVS